MTSMQSFSPSPGEPGYRGPNGPIWTEDKITMPTANEARHLCHRIISNPPVEIEGGDLGPHHIKIIVAAATAGLSLMDKQSDLIERIEATGSPWRLRVPIKSAKALGLAYEILRYNQIVSQLVGLGWLQETGGGNPKVAPRYGLSDPL